MSQSQSRYVLEIQLSDSFPPELANHYRSYKCNGQDSGVDLILPEDYSFSQNSSDDWTPHTINHKISCQLKKYSSDDSYQLVSYWLLPRSSISKTPLRMANSVGLIDSGYRGNIIAKVDLHQKCNDYTLIHGQRLFQIVTGDLTPISEVKVVESLEESLRGTGGFGSTGWGWSDFNIILEYMGGCVSIRDGIFKARESDILEFMIVLKPVDYHNICPLVPSYSQRLRRSEGSFPGILHIVNINSINKIDKKTGQALYTFQDIVIPRVLYLKLPKEGVYVRHDSWEYEYLKSQIQEIIYIFALLGAKTVNYEVINSSSNKSSTGVDLNMQHLSSGIAVESGVKVSRGNSLSSELSGSLEFSEARGGTKRPTIDLLLKSKNIHYLARKYDWRQMCIQRIERSVSSDNFHFMYHSDMYIDANMSAAINSLGIGFQLKNSQLNSLSIKFSVEYYPLVSEKWFRNYLSFRNVLEITREK